MRGAFALWPSEKTMSEATIPRFELGITVKEGQRVTQHCPTENARIPHNSFVLRQS